MTFKPFVLAAVMAALATPASAMSVSSISITDGKTMPDDQAYPECGGGNISPALSWSGEPSGTKSFAITMFDTDANDGAGWWHWLAFNIPANVHSIGPDAGRADQSSFMQATNDFGDAQYDGACPPNGSGLHHYQVTVWALGTPGLTFGTTAHGKQVGAYLQKHALAHATITTTLERW